MKYYQVHGASWCGFCTRAMDLLKSKGEFFIFCDIGCSNQLVDEFKKKYDYPTIPIVSFKDTEAGTEEFIGGFTSLEEHFHRLDYEQGTDLSEKYCTRDKNEEKI
jgi:glutaredoxin-related protein